MRGKKKNLSVGCANTAVGFCAHKNEHEIWDEIFDSMKFKPQFYATS